jgi:hypothetical protein
MPGICNRRRVQQGQVQRQEAMTASSSMYTPKDIVRLVIADSRMTWPIGNIF